MLVANRDRQGVLRLQYLQAGNRADSARRQAVRCFRLRCDPAGGPNVREFARLYIREAKEAQREQRDILEAMRQG